MCVYIACKRKRSVMGRNKSFSKNKKKKQQKVQNGYTVDDLLDRVEEYLDCFEFDLAIKFCNKALEIDPVNVRVLETTGNAYAEIGEVDSSKNCFLKAVEVDRDHGHEKYMYLGQMSTGEEAKKYYLKGIEIMKRTLETGNVNSDVTSKSAPITVRDISNAYCALAEIFLTDSCEEEDAEKNCEEFSKLAISCDENNPDAYIVMASFLLSKDEKDEATKVLSVCFDLLNISKLTETAENEDLGEDEDVEEDEDIEENGGIEEDKDLDDGADIADESDKQASDEERKMASYSSRFALAKMLIEVELHEKAEAVLMGLVEENDEDVEVWYMLGWNLILQEQVDDAAFFLAKAFELYEKLKYEDEALLEHLKELLEKCKCSVDIQEEGGEEMETE